jgi:hypothetical protein
MVTRDQLAKIVMEAVQDVLGRTDIAESDNFFDVGGRSILVLRVVHRINQLLNTKLPIRYLYRARDLRQFIAETLVFLSTCRHETQMQISAVQDRRRLPASSTQFHIFRAAHKAPSSLQFNLPYCLRLTGSLDVPRLEIALRNTVQLHEALRVKFESTGEELWQIPHDSPVFDLTPIAIDEFPVELRTKILLELMDVENSIPISLFDEALVRANLVRKSPVEHFILFSFHHIAADGRSIRIFVEDLFRQYENVERDDCQSGSGRLQFGDFVHWQLTQLRNGGFRPQFDYWLDLLAPPWHPCLPAGNAESACASSPTSALVRISEKRTEELASSAKNTQVALQSLFVTAIALWLRRSGLQDVRIAIQFDGRTREQFENVVGPLVTTLVLRIDISAAHTDRDLLKLVDQRLLEAYEHADLPPENLVAAVADRFNLPLGGLCQVLLVMDDLYPTSFHSAGLTVSRFQHGQSIQLQDMGPFKMIFAAKWTGAEFEMHLTALSYQEETTDILNAFVENLISFVQ